MRVTTILQQRRSGRQTSDDSFSERAYQQIRDKILRGEYPLGAALSRRKLAEELGMSFLPVSEALQRLEMDGVVESKPRVGTRVRVPTKQDIRERYMLREALETQAAREFVEHASEQIRLELLNMGRHLDQLYACCEGGDSDFLYSVHSYHMKFHLRIAEASNCRLLREAIEREQVLVFNWLFDTAAERRTLPTKFHLELATALASGDVDIAERNMRAHIRYGLDDVLRALEPRPDAANWRLRRNDHG
ncbi:MAG: GntR family transcriptional regulator [Bryobacteraceae bacterium]